MRKTHDLFSQVYRRSKHKVSFVLGISGSPRRGGNSDVLLDKALEGAQSLGAKAEKIILNDLVFSPCQSCEELSDNGNCLITDDMQTIYPMVQEADILIVSSPVFFGSLSAQTKMMIDRFQCWWRAKHVLNIAVQNKDKIGAFICVQADNKKKFFDNSRSIIKNFFVTVNTEYSEELLCSGLDEKGSVLKSPDILEKAIAVGQKMIKNT
ncbi:MAG: flavodoxin family protein [PVC group bacterium]|nr:flavodoxin family protein [PVC group bacterium]